MLLLYMVDMWYRIGRCARRTATRRAARPSTPHAARACDT